MAYRPIQNESAHLTDKPGRHSFGKKSGKKGRTETAKMKQPMKLEKSKPGKTRS